MKQLLCPFDFSDAAINAVEYAARFAQESNMELVLCHIEQVAAWHGMVPVGENTLPLADDRIQVTAEQLGSYAATVGNQFRIKCRADVKAYAMTVADALGEEIARNDFELVVMGTSGADRQLDAFFGTTTYRVIRDAKKLLLMVPENCRFEKPSRILYATDYCPDDQGHITHLLTLFARYRPKLTVFHVSKKRTPVSDEIYRCVRNVLADELGQKRNVRFKRAIGDDVAGIVTEVMRDHDLLVLLTRKRDLISRIFQRSAIRKLSLTADFPILVYPYQMND